MHFFFINVARITTNIVVGNSSESVTRLNLAPLEDFILNSFQTLNLFVKCLISDLDAGESPFRLRRSSNGLIQRSLVAAADTELIKTEMTTRALNVTNDDDGCSMEYIPLRQSGKGVLGE